jgi:peptidoglycan/LPS O-acetylase OafA/YrhL
MSASKTQRHHELDWLRVMAVAAVFLNHVLGPYSGGWVVRNDVASPFVQPFVQATSGMRMPLMFFVAGAALVLALGGKPVGPYALERAEKLVIPLLFGLAVLIPAQLVAAASANGTLADGGLLAAASPLRPDGTVTWAHLWFLTHILAATVLLVPLALKLRTWAARPMGSWVTDRYLLVTLGCLPLGAQGVRHSWVEGLAISRVIDLRGFATSLAFMLAGVIVMSLPNTGAMVVRYRRGALTVFVVLTTLQMGVANVTAAWAPYAAILVWPLAAWAWVLAAYGYARHYLRRSSAVVTRLGTSSYAFYLVHQPIVVVTAVVITPLSLPIWFEGLLLGTVALAFSVAVCVGARYSQIARTVLGFRERRCGARSAFPAQAPVLQ